MFYCIVISSAFLSLFCKMLNKNHYIKFVNCIFKMYSDAIHHDNMNLYIDCLKQYASTKLCQNMAWELKQGQDR